MMIVVKFTRQRKRENGGENLKKEGKKAILAVSFGTSVNATREKTIDAVERDLAEAFPEYCLYRAWTSGKIIRKLAQRDGVRIDTVQEAMERMLSDEVEELLVQPTHVIDGIENDRMRADVEQYRERFRKATFGAPLLSGEEDSRVVIRAVMEEFSDLPADEALVFMGHGTTHHANEVYTALDAMFQEMGYVNVHLGTVEATSSLEKLLQRVRASGAKRVTLAPFMLVAGDHALHDLSGEDPDSWRSRFEAEGFTVNCTLRGLGEYAGVRRLYVEHARAAVSR